MYLDREETEGLISGSTEATARFQRLPHESLHVRSGWNDVNDTKHNVPAVSPAPNEGSVYRTREGEVQVENAGQ